MALRKLGHRGRGESKVEPEVNGWVVVITMLWELYQEYAFFALFFFLFKKIHTCSLGWLGNNLSHRRGKIHLVYSRRGTYRGFKVTEHCFHKGVQGQDRSFREHSTSADNAVWHCHLSSQGHSKGDNVWLETDSCGQQVPRSRRNLLFVTGSTHEISLKTPLERHFDGEDGPVQTAVLKTKRKQCLNVNRTPHTFSGWVGNWTKGLDKAILHSCGMFGW